MRHDRARDALSVSHEPTVYQCPFCMLQQGVFDERNQPTDVVGVTGLAYARIAPKWWLANPGALLVIPRRHHENLYDLPDDVGHEIWDLTRRVAVAMKKVYQCDGVSSCWAFRRALPDGDRCRSSACRRELTHVQQASEAPLTEGYGTR
jgi:hypothetical protein